MGKDNIVDSNLVSDNSLAPQFIYLVPLLLGFDIGRLGSDGEFVHGGIGNNNHSRYKM